MIEDVGLLSKGDLGGLPQVFSDWKLRGSGLGTPTKPEVHPDRGPKSVHVKACAVWDTVSSIGNPLKAFFNRPSSGTLGFVHSHLSCIIRHGFQAISLDERRRHFLPIVWRISEADEVAVPNSSTGPSISQNLEQCWFSGEHLDIGGSRNENSLGHLALIWMISKLQRFLTFEESILDNRRARPQRVSEVSPWTLDDKKLWWMAGSQSRKALCHFWGIHGVRKFRPVPSDQSFETIHYSVRVMMSVKLYS